MFEQNIDGLKRSLSTKSRRMSRITEIALVTNYYWTNPKPPNSNVTTTTAAKRFKLLKTINKQQQIIQTNNKITFCCILSVIYIDIYIYILCICICIVFRYQFDSINTNVFFMCYRNRFGLLSFFSFWLNAAAFYSIYIYIVSCALF